MTITSLLNTNQYVLSDLWMHCRMVLLMCYFHNQDQDWPYQFSSEIILSLFVTHPQKRKRTIHAYFGLIFWSRHEVWEYKPTLFVWNYCYKCSRCICKTGISLDGREQYAPDVGQLFFNSIHRVHQILSRYLRWVTNFTVFSIALASRAINFFR